MTDTYLYKQIGTYVKVNLLSIKIKQLLKLITFGSSSSSPAHLFTSVANFDNFGLSAIFSINKIIENLEAKLAMYLLPTLCLLIK